MRTVRPLKLALTTIATTGVLTVAACGGPAADSAADQPEAGGGEIPSASSESLVEPAQDEGKLVWYTSNTRPAADAIAQSFEKKYPGIDVEIFQAGGSQVIAKVEAEAMAGQIEADIVDYSEGAAAEGQAKRGLFQPYLPPNIGDIPDNLADDNGYWFSPFYLTSTIVYNSDILNKNEAPTSWAELVDPKWKDKVGMASPDYAGTAVATVAAWQQEFGDDYVNKLGDNGPSVFEGFGNVHDAVLSGQTPVGVNLSFRALVADAEGEPMNWITPKEGQIQLSFATAIPKDAEHPTAAKLFANFLLTKELQTMVAKNIGYFPAITEVAKAAGMPDTSQMKLISPDVQKMSEPEYIANVKELFNQATS